MDRRSVATNTAVDTPSTGFNALLWIVLGASLHTALLYSPTSIELASRCG